MGSSIRTDIQALRGVAVLAVLIYHSGLSATPSGFLGVDIFFVISGFLITGGLVQQRDLGGVDLFAFYMRRARRLLPASFTVFALVAVLSPMFLSSAAMADLTAQLLGAVTYSINFVLAQQSSYFDTAAEQKPLLHVWSLSLEEQYYFLLPLLIIASPRRHLLTVVSSVTIVSLLLCFLRVFGETNTFFLLPTRLWELGIGSIGAVIAVAPRWRALLPYLCPLAALAVALILFRSPGGVHPGWAALLTCVATLTLILGAPTWLNAGALPRALAWVGDISYSLYLVHWPLIVFFRQAWMGENTSAVSGFLIVAAIGLAWLLYHFVEQPFRRPGRWQKPVVLAGAAIGTIAIPASAYALAISPSNTFRELFNRGLSERCEFADSFTAPQDCMTARQPKVLVWGDSFAMALVPGLAAQLGTHGVAQATKSVCGPTVGVAPMERVMKYGYGREWAKGCLAFNDSVIEFVRNTPSVEYVVLSSPLRQYIDQQGFGVLTRGDGLIETPSSADALLAGLRNTVEAVRRAGRKVVLIAPPPSASFNIRTCLDRKSEGRLVFGPFSRCSVPVEAHHRINAKVLAVLERMASEIDLNVISLEDALCDNGTCETQSGDQPLYIDGDHLSQGGSVIVAQRARLLERVQSSAR
jgi:peptidoglycan/LPS O-acetylase OafA/YrhL